MMLYPDTQLLQQELLATGIARKKFAETAGISLKTLSNMLAGKGATLKTLISFDKAVRGERYQKDGYRRFLPAKNKTAHEEKEATDEQLWDGPGSLLEKLKATAKRHPSGSGQLMVLSQDVTIQADSDGGAHVRYMFHIANVGSKPVPGIWRRLWFVHPQDTPSLQLSGRWNGKRSLTIDMETDLPNNKHFFLPFPRELAPLETCRLRYEFDLQGEYTGGGNFWDVFIWNLTKEISLHVTVKTDKIVKFTQRRSDTNGLKQTWTLPIVHPRNGECKMEMEIKFPLVGEQYGLTWVVT